jgi:hypothetical protein
MNETKSAVLKNYSMACGRIGLLVLFAPILIAISCLYATDEQASMLAMLTLVGLCTPFVWLAVTVPILVKLDDHVSVRYLLGRFECSSHEVTKIHFSEISTSFAPGALLPGFESGVRQYRVAQIQFSNRKTIIIKVDNRQMALLKGWYDSRET